MTAGFFAMPSLFAGSALIADRAARRVRRSQRLVAALLSLPTVLCAQGSDPDIAQRLLSSDGPPWELRFEEAGLSVETRSLEGWKIKQFRAAGRIEAPPEAVLARIEDVDAYPEWFPNTIEAKPIELPNGDSGNYVRTGAPWPVKDRDAVYTQRLKRSPGFIRIEVGVAPDALPTAEGAVRVRTAGGYWELREVRSEEGLAHTDLTWQFFLDPAGNIPSSLANTRVVESPRVALYALREYFVGYHAK